MLRNTIKGSHTEYLANYYLSILGFSTPVPRQEDYGKVDLFASTLNIYPASLFWFIIKGHPQCSHIFFKHGI